MSASITRWSHLAFLLLVSSATAHAQSRTQNQYLSVHIGTAMKSYRLGSEINITLDVANPSGQKILVPTYIDQPEQGGFEFIVKPQGAAVGSQVQMTPYMWSVGGGKDPMQNVSKPDEMFMLLGPMKGGTWVPPNGSVQFVALLNDLYVIDKPGVYDIHVFKWPSENSGFIRGPRSTEPTSQPIPVESNTIQVIVTDPPTPTISVELTARSQYFLIGSKIDADVAVTNVSTVPIKVPFDPGHPSAEENGVKFSGIASAGPPDQPMRSKVDYWWKNFNYQYPIQQTLLPKQTIHYPVQLADVLDVRSRGTYTIEATKVDPVTHLEVKSNLLTIMVQ